MGTKGAVLQNGMLANVCTTLWNYSPQKWSFETAVLMHAYSEEIDGCFKSSCHTPKQVQTH